MDLGRDLLHDAGPVSLLHAEPLVWTLRLYDEPDGYARRLPYRAIATATVTGDRAWLSGLHGRFDRAAWREIRDWLLAQGVTSAAMERRGRVIVLVDERASRQGEDSLTSR